MQSDETSPSQELIEEIEKALEGTPEEYLAIYWPPDKHGIARRPLQPDLSRPEPLTEADVLLLAHVPRLLRSALSVMRAQAERERTLREALKEVGEAFAGDDGKRQIAAVIRARAALSPAAPAQEDQR